jgi:hypothetical protein
LDESLNCSGVLPTSAEPSAVRRCTTSGACNDCAKAACSGHDRFADFDRGGDAVPLLDFVAFACAINSLIDFTGREGGM